MKVIDCVQGSEEWMKARAGIPTASEFDQLLTPKLEPRKGQMPATYLHRKLAEWWLGGPLMTFTNYNMDAGQILETEALPFYSLMHSVEIKRVGFITTDDGKVGCSPDGMIGDEGIEIKCPAIQTHFGWLLDGGLPEEHAAQVYGSLYVTGAQGWHFVSYHRRTPLLETMVTRDEAIMGRIEDALGMFLERFDRAKQRIIELNGGPPTGIS
jgi:hypothetical protein